MKKFAIILFTFFCFHSINFAQQKTATVKEYLQTFTTYPFSDPNPIPLFTPVYPYYRYDGFTDKSIQKQWKVVQLENDYIKVMILPEIGGKIWAAIEKSTNRPFIYYNHSVKFRDVAMRGPWTSGGLEANYAIIGHTPNCATPVDYITKTNEDSSVSCIIGVLDLLTRTNWRVEINLQKDKAYFTTQSFWYNSTVEEEPYYHWMNTGIKAKGNLEFIYPGNRYIGHEGEYSDWPVNKSNGKKISFYEQNNFGGYKSYHVFGKYANFFGGYWHDDDFGMARYSAHDDKAGKKIWIWGLSGQGMIWEKLLTDTDGQYVEVQSGRLFNQSAPGSSFTPFKHRSFAPYATDIWKEYWFPVLHTKGFVEANEYGALNTKYENGWLKIFFSPTQSLTDTLKIKDHEKIIYNKQVQLSPLKVFTDSVKTDADTLNLTISIGVDKFIYESNPNANVLSRPVESPKNFDWNSVYGLYMAGKELMDQKMYAQAEEKLSAALQKDSNYLPALVKMSELLYRNMRYGEALALAKYALSIDTHAGDANYYYGLINAKLGNTVDAKDGFDIATLSAEYRSAAYTELSKLYLKEKNFDKAIAYAAKAVDYNRYNITALQLQAVIYRYQNDSSKAEEVLKEILSFDPLNHFAGFEKYLSHSSEENKKNFLALIQNELPQETFLELGIWYYTIGCKGECEKVLSLIPESSEAIYWLSFLHHTKVDCNNINPNLVFPFRSETAAVLEELLKNQNDWLLKYHLALIYKDRNRIDESKKLFISCGDEPAYAPFYAARAEIFKDSISMAIADLQKALSLDNQWRYHKLLVEYYNNHQQYEKALPVVENFYHAHSDYYIMGMLYAKTLLLNKRYKESDAVLSKLHIIPFEGATESHELYREVKLMEAVERMQKKDYSKAVSFISEAKQWPENLGVGKLYDEDIDDRLENWMDYLCYSHLKKSEDAYKSLQRIVQFNSTQNVYPENALVTAWAFEKLNQKDKGIEWLDEQTKSFPGNKKLLWSKSMFEGNNNFTLSPAEKDANVRILEQLMLIK